MGNIAEIILDTDDRRSRKRLRTTMVVEAGKNWACIAWVKFNNPYEGLPVDKFGECVRAVGGLHNLTRRIYAPAPARVGQVTGVGKTKTFDMRMIDFIRHHRARTLLWAGDTTLWDDVCGELYPLGSGKQPDGRRVNLELVSLKGIKVSELVNGHVKEGCGRAMQYLIDLVERDDWSVL